MATKSISSIRKTKTNSVRNDETASTNDDSYCDQVKEVISKFKNQISFHHKPNIIITKFVAPHPDLTLSYMLKKAINILSYVTPGKLNLIVLFLPSNRYFECNGIEVEMEENKRQILSSSAHSAIRMVIPFHTETQLNEFIDLLQPTHTILWSDYLPYYNDKQITNEGEYIIVDTLMGSLEEGEQIVSLKKGE